MINNYNNLNNKIFNKLIKFNHYNISFNNNNNKKLYTIHKKNK